MPADLAVLNARIYTAELGAPWAEALAAAGGRLQAVGSAEEVEPLIGPGTEVLDAGGRLVVPGFIDAHVHLIWGYELGSWLDLLDRPSLGEVQRRLAAYARDRPDAPILLGHGFEYAALGVDGLPTRDALDAVVRDRPVLLTAFDGHTGLGNSAFVERALAVQAEARADVGEMVREPATGEPTGVFLRTFDVMARIPEVQGLRSLDGLRETVSAASRVGITTAFDVQVNLEDLHAYDDLRREGGLTVRIRAALYHPRGTPPARAADFVKAHDRFQDDWLRVGAVKLYIDGVLETGTGALLEPYANDPASRGPTVYPVPEFEALVGEFDRLGFQVCTHACGDAGVRIALDAYERAARTNRTSGRRHRIEHCEAIAAADIPRFARLGVVPCMQPCHAAPELGRRWAEAAGPDRTEASFPWRELLDAGAPLAFASDWPVAELDPLKGIREAVARETLDGRPSAHRVTVREAVDGYTRRAAFACHAEATRGTLEAGKFADLAVLSEDLFEIPMERIGEVRVVRTVVGGRVVYSDGTPLP